MILFQIIQTQFFLSQNRLPMRKILVSFKDPKYKTNESEMKKKKLYREFGKYIYFINLIYECDLN